jgi:cytochrome c biogenesis protein CcmG/thiol:disulfide interchange protein DsbE
MAEGLFMSRWVRFAPLVLFILLLAAMAWRLAVPGDEVIESKLAGKPVPAFTAAPVLPGKAGLASTDFHGGGPRLLNFFASWCVPCVAEARMLGELKAQGVAIDGIAVRDKPEDVARFLADHGDPYQRIGGDPQSAVQIALGSSGVPESFVIDGKGVIRYQHIGAIEAEDTAVILAQIAAAK